MSLVNDSSKVVSPSETYVALCIKSNFNGYYFKKFALPKDPQQIKYLHMKNNAEWASWYFLNVLNFEACIAGIIPFEEYKDISEQKKPFEDVVLAP